MKRRSVLSSSEVAMSRSRGQHVGSFCRRFDGRTEGFVYTVPSFWHRSDSVGEDIFVMAQKVGSHTAEYGSIYRVSVPYQGQLLFCDPSEPPRLEDAYGWYCGFSDFVGTWDRTSYGEFKWLVRLPSMVYKGQPSCEIFPVGNIRKDPPSPQFNGIPQGGYDYSEKVVMVVSTIKNFVASFGKPGV